MKKKMISLVMSAVMLFSAISFAGCQEDSAELQEKMNALQASLEEKSKEIEELQAQFEEKAEEVKKLEKENQALQNEYQEVMQGNTKFDSRGKSYSLLEAYQYGLLTLEDIKHISYFRTGAVHTKKDGLNWEKIEFVSTMEEPVLTRDIEEYLIERYYRNYFGLMQETDTAKQDLKVKYYAGKYGNCYVAGLQGNWDIGAGSFEVYVGGIVWNEMSCNYTVFVAE